ncbi:hypothetical protein TCAL_14566 [Tigriopus californicus]|uniref:EamA domain-containing protein n=1 Tax=Tigriopus californicus TaxID=6832 RepID=A0A553PAW9_TIGCA|nr:hypothetical protein TCAL_14566 [Tigriopus californicus]
MRVLTNSFLVQGIRECFGIAAGLSCAILEGLLLVYIRVTEVSKSQILLIEGGFSILGGLAIGPWMPESQIFHTTVDEFPTVTLKVTSGATFAVTGLILWTFAIGKAPSVLLSLISSTECVTSFGVQMFLFKEALNVLQIIGVVLVMISLVVATFYDSHLETKKKDYIKMEEKTMKTQP